VAKAFSNGDRLPILLHRFNYRKVVWTYGLMGQDPAKGAVIEPLRGRKVLVTGGCGFIGVNLVANLVAEGAVVTVLDLDAANWHNLPDAVTQVRGDVLGSGCRGQGV